jgi:hypothetical protein
MATKPKASIPELSRYQKLQRKIQEAASNQVGMRDKILKKLAGIPDEEKLTPERVKELTTCAMKYSGAFLMLIIAGITIYVASTDDKALTEGFFKYMVFLIVPIIIGSALVLPIFTQRVTTTTIVMNVSILFVFILAIYGFYQIKSPESVLFAKYALYGLVVLGLIVGLAIVYKFAIRYIYGMRGWVAAVVQFIFFIPCLLLDFVEFVKQELNIAPKTVYVLFGFEILIIASYFLVPYLFSAKPKPTTDVILNEPVFLNYETRVADYKTLIIDNKSEFQITQKHQFRVNFAVSFWAYLNTSTIPVPVTIFRIGPSIGTRGRPCLKFENGKYAFYLGNNIDVPQYTLELPIQKWNHIVISYNDGNANLFINGNLEKTYKLDSDDIIQYSEQDVIVVGSNHSKNNVGAICNVRYHKSPIRQYDVIKEYNLLMYKNPPHE